MSNINFPGFWSEEKLLEELKTISSKLNHFPSLRELTSLKRHDLTYAIHKYGGFNKFRKILGANLINQRNNGFWKDEAIIDELKKIIIEIKRFPSQSDLMKLKRNDLFGAIQRRGGFIKFRKLLNCELTENPKDFWTNETVIAELRLISEKLGYFPSLNDLDKMGKGGLMGGIRKNGGMPKFKEVLGFYVTLQEKYKSELAKYCNYRGKNSEKLVIEILKDYCKRNNYPEPILNKKLSKGNVIEIVCDIGKNIGIDVTNTKTGRRSINHKWTKKDYYKLLDELWIIVISDVYDETDFFSWNAESPDNVKVMSIDTFLKELDYSTNESTKQKIEKYKSCTFHSKNELKEKKEPIVNNLEEYLA